MKRKIARDLKNDKRSKRMIKAKVLKTRVYLTIDNITLNLSIVESKRISETLDKALSIQETVNIKPDNCLKLPNDINANIKKALSYANDLMNNEANLYA